MKLHFFFLLFLFVWVSVYSQKPEKDNPFFFEYKTPFKTPPFDKIKNEHFMPAYLKGMEEEKKEVEAIINTNAKPTFKNTIEAFERAGVLLDKVSSVFSALQGSNTNDEIQKIAKELSPLQSKHRDDIILNEKLFERVKTVYDQKDKLNLTSEQNMLLEKIYKRFVRGGANLPAEKKEKLREINKELSILSIKFGENLLKETNKFKLIIEDKNDLDGLPSDVITEAATTAKSSGLQGKWVFTLQKPSMIPFLQYSSKRELREKIFQAYNNRCNNNNEFDNKIILSKIAAFRVQKSNLLGYKSHADFVLEENMSKTPDNVYKLLNQLWSAALPNAKKESEELQKMIDKEGGNFKLQASDWWYYAEKLRKEKYDLDENQMRPYFKLENVRKGAFDLAGKLFGIKFIKRDDIPKYHNEVEVFEVKNNDDSHVGIFYTDYFPRASKRGGAWANSLRKQSRSNNKMIAPLICNTGNFSKPVSDKPALLSFEEVNTLFHEFGHALHALLSNCTYNTLSGSSVPRDFVELPSQIMENWIEEPEVLKSFAKHYETGEVIPDLLIGKIKKSSLFNQGFLTVEYLAASFLDMDWHTLKEPKELDAEKFENESLSKIGLIPEIVVRYKSPFFQHIFSGGYSAGYYSYIWAEVLDSDAFGLFKEKGLFDKKTADSFRKNILEKGGTDDPMKMYVKFRGAEPKIDALLKKRGLN